jgi:hypothetical protein
MRQESTAPPRQHTTPRFPKPERAPPPPKVNALAGALSARSKEAEAAADVRRGALGALALARALEQGRPVPRQVGSERRGASVPQNNGREAKRQACSVCNIGTGTWGGVSSRSLPIQGLGFATWQQSQRHAAKKTPPRRRPAQPRPRQLLREEGPGGAVVAAVAAALPADGASCSGALHVLAARAPAPGLV